MKKLITYIEDCVLSFLQKRCDHMSNMVAADILEACVDGCRVAYCRRCGSVRIDWSPNPPERGLSQWRRPDPHLWRG